MKNILLIILLISISNNIFAQAKKKTKINAVYEKAQIYERYKTGDVSIEEVKLNPMTYLASESLVYSTNDSGIKYNWTYTGNDKNLIDFSFRVNSDLAKFSDILGGTFIYSRKISGIWFSFLGEYISGTFDELATNTREAEVNLSFKRPISTSSTLISVGPGIGHRFKALFIPMDDIFESINAFITYNVFKDDFIKENYSGIGFRAEYGIAYRIGPHTNLGFKFAYNFANTNRSKKSGESSKDTNVNISFCDFALNVGFYL